MKKVYTVDMFLTHNDLVEIAREWLTKTCPVVITEMASNISEIPDAIGWAGAKSIVIECKLSVADFKSHKRKIKARSIHKGMGQYQYILAPKGLLNKADIPTVMGFLEYDGKKVYQTIKAKHRVHYDAKGERILLCSALRRIGHDAPNGISIRCYTIETNNRASLTLGGNV